MAHGAALGLTITRLTRLIRQRRALFYGVRGLVWGLGLAVVPVALRAMVGPWALPVAAGVAAGGALAGVLYGILLRVPPVDVLGLADRAFGLKDRLATAHDLLARPDRGELADAAIADAETHATQITLGRAVAWRWPREVKLLPAPVLLLAVLPYLPPIPIPDVSMPSFTPAAEEEKKPEATGPQQALERPAQKKSEKVERVEMQDRDYQTRPNPESREHTKGDLAAAFKDTNVATKRPDFSSFLKQGDDRIRLLERVDSLPDLQRDFTQSQYKVMFRKSRSLLSGIDPRQLTPEKLRQLLEEMNRMGRRPGSGSGGRGRLGPGDDGRLRGARSGPDGQGHGGDGAGPPEDAGPGRARPRGQGPPGREGNADGRRARAGRPPGRGRARLRRGAGVPARQGDEPGLEGRPHEPAGPESLRHRGRGRSMRKGRRESYDTNMLGKGAQNPSRLPSMSVVTQYRKMMEEALAKEAIPLDYRSQVRDYFQALEER